MKNKEKNDNVVEEIYFKMFSDAESEKEAIARERLEGVMREHGIDEETIFETVAAFSIECGCYGFAQGLGLALEMQLDVSKVGELC